MRLLVADDELVAPPYCGLGVGSEAIDEIAGRRR
jgi:hypothetical protein